MWPRLLVRKNDKFSSDNWSTASCSYKTLAVSINCDVKSFLTVSSAVLNSISSISMWVKRKGWVGNIYLLIGRSLLLNRQKQLKFSRKLFFRVKAVRKVNSSDAAVSVNLNSQSFNVVCSVSSASKIRQVKLNLVPSIIQSHWHCANKRLYSRSTLKLLNR